jgi:hypothetical protein
VALLEIFIIDALIKKNPAGAGFLEVLFLGLPPSAGCQAASANNSSLAVI